MLVVASRLAGLACSLAHKLAYGTALRGRATLATGCAGASPIKRARSSSTSQRTWSHQPVDLCRQLHIALNANGGLVTTQGALRQGQGDGSVTSRRKSGWGAFGRHD